MSIQQLLRRELAAAYDRSDARLDVAAVAPDLPRRALCGPAAPRALPKGALVRSHNLSGGGLHGPVMVAAYDRC